MTAGGPRRGPLGALQRAWPGELVGEVNLVALEAVGSTQALARRLLERHAAEEEDPAPVVIVALAQSDGRGRRGRRWESAAGLGVWASLALPVEQESLAALPMRAAVSLASRVRAEGSVDCRLKWPNDLVVGRKKLGGLLVDVFSGPSGASWAIVGFGINHGHTNLDLPVPTATSLRLVSTGELPGVSELTIGCLTDLWRDLRSPEAGWLERYRELSVHRVGDRLSFELEGERVEGTLAGFDASGGLLLDTDGGRREIRSGEVYSW